MFHFNGLQALLLCCGIPAERANLIATASQAVDDFHEDELLVFENGEPFYPVVTAHRTLDHRNIDSRDASNIWMPFHFFPNEKGVCEPETENIEKLLGFYNDYSDVMGKNNKQRDLLTGILLHIIVDTYTHKGFMGLYCRHNDISDLDDNESIDIGWIAGNIPPSIGHGEALTYPDDMWRKWSYTDNLNKRVERNNRNIFLEIVEKVPGYLRKMGYDVNELDNEQTEKFKQIFSKVDKKNKVASGEFNKITASCLDYDFNFQYKKWKNQIMRRANTRQNRYIRIVDKEEYLNSEWYLFQKLAEKVRIFFKSDIFPELRIETKVY